MWYVYLLLCDQKTFYVGITPDMKSRLAEHRNKESFFTKKFSDIGFTGLRYIDTDIPEIS